VLSTDTVSTVFIGQFIVLSSIDCVLIAVRLVVFVLSLLNKLSEFSSFWRRRLISSVL